MDLEFGSGFPVVELLLIDDSMDRLDDEGVMEVFEFEGVLFTVAMSLASCD